MLYGNYLRKKTEEETVTVTARLQVAIVAMDINHDRKCRINNIMLK